MAAQNNLALEQVAVNAETFLRAEAQLKAEAAAWVEKRLEGYREAVEESVLDALDEGHSVSDVARAYTVSGKTANRNAIYAIRDAHAGEDRTDRLPFEWSTREVTTVRGTRTVFDIVAMFFEFGPAEYTGTVTWRYDEATGIPEQILETDKDPYPEDQEYYKGVFQRWLESNPYPGEE